VRTSWATALAAARLRVNAPHDRHRRRSAGRAKSAPAQGSGDTAARAPQGHASCAGRRLGGL